MGTLPLPAVLCVFPSLLLPLEKCLFFSVINLILDLKYCVIPTNHELGARVLIPSKKC